MGNFVSTNLIHKNRIEEEMSIALENNRIDGVSKNGFFRRNNNKMLQCNLGFLDRGDRPMMMRVERENRQSDVCSTSSSSSIGENSDDDEEKQDCGEENEEVQSKLKENPFDSAIGALEQALPIRRGISKFYNGKSKSFASLGDATCSSIKEITKPENAYTRKRKNLLAYSLLYDKGGRASVLKTPGIGGGIAKRPIPSSRSTLGLAVAMGHYNDSACDENGPSLERSESPRTPSASPPESPLHPSSWRSFSLVDLQHCGVSVSGVKSNLGYQLMMGKRTKTEEVRNIMTDIM